MKPFFATLLLFVSSLSFTPVAHADDSSLVISELNVEFFYVNPKMLWGNDPFLKGPGYVKISVEPPVYTLNGIAYSEEDPIAVVNGKTVHVGETVGERWVSEIGENFVLLKKGASELEINLPPIPEDSEDDDLDSPPAEKKE